MSSELGKIIADFQTSLATTISIGGTSGTLVSNTDDDGVTLPNGRYFFTIDGGNTFKEHISCTLTGKEMTDICSVSRQGVETSGAVKSHRVGATIIITDFAHIKKLNNLLDGTTDLDADNPLKYDADPTLTDDKELVTKKYMDAVANNGSPDASTSAKGIAKLSVAPASSTDPIAVGTNDPRIPTADQKAALAGTGTPSGTNKFVTADDENLTNNVKTSGDQTVAGVKTFSSLPVLPATTPTSSNQAVSKKYIDGLTAVTTVTNLTDTGVGGNVTIAYHKMGKLYFGLRMRPYGSSIWWLFDCDSTSVDRLCTLLSKTASAAYTNITTSYGSSGYAPPSQGPYVSYWDTGDSCWKTHSTGGTNSYQTSYLAGLKVSD